MLIGEKIKQIREKKNLSQESLEILTTKPKIKQSTLSRFESSERIPKQNQLEELARVLDISVEELTDNADMNPIEKPSKRKVQLTVCVNPKCSGLTEEETSFASLMGKPIRTKEENNTNNTQLRNFNTVMAETGDNYCGYCGSDLISTCSICDNPIKVTNKPFCSKCGYYYFYLCEHIIANGDLYVGQKEISPSPLYIHVRGKENEDFDDTDDPSLKMWDPVNEAFKTELIRIVLDPSQFEEVEILESDEFNKKTPESMWEPEGFIEYKLMKYKGHDDLSSFPVRLIKDGDNIIYERFVSRLTAYCEFCGIEFEYDADQNEFKSEDLYEF